MDEWKAKMLPYSLGHKASDESKAKMSAVRKGHPHHGPPPVSEEIRAKHSVARKGHSDETRAKMSATRLGRPHPTKRSKKMLGDKAK